MSRFCRYCGSPLEPNQAFCRNCGKSAAPGEQAAFQSHMPASAAAQTAISPKQKKKTGLIIGVAASVLVLILLIVGVTALLRNQNEPDPATLMTQTTQVTTQTTATQAELVSLLPFPDSLMPSSKPTVTCTFEALDVIIPANYRSLDHIVHLQCWTDQGTTDVLISVEIPGFTQRYEQKLTISRLETEISVHPPLLPEAIDALHSSKDAQINIHVSDLANNNLVVQETYPVKLYSRYDMQWQDRDGTPYYENILAWVTPEADEIRELLRLSADSCTELTDGALNAIVGYQPVSDWSAEEITYVQTACMMHALSAKMDVKYVMAPFSATSSELQRVATPAQVINSASGLCVETAVTLASAIQATNMHAVLILLPGHMQVAVETWYNSGEYFLIETTALDAADNQLFDSVINYTMTVDDWYDYLSGEGVVAIDCDLAESLQIQSID